VLLARSLKVKNSQSAKQIKSNPSPTLPCFAREGAGAVSPHNYRMPTFVLFPTLILAAPLPVSRSGDLQRCLRTVSESDFERVRLLRRCK
jgi:hypothetical protein